MGDAGGKAAAAFGALSSALGGPKRESLVRQFNGCVLFDLGDAGKWTLDLRVAAGDKAGVRKGDAANGTNPDLTVLMKEAVFLKLIAGDLDPQNALINGACGRRACCASARLRAASMLRSGAPAKSCASGAESLHCAGDLKIRGNMGLATKLGPVLRAAGEARAKAKL
jgi:putative sterol carrier protein